MGIAAPRAIAHESTDCYAHASADLCWPAARGPQPAIGTRPAALPALANTVVAAAPPISNPFVIQPNALTVRITQSGLVAIPASTLTTAGWAVDQIAAATLHVWDGPTEVPISITGGTGTTLSDTTIRFIGHANTSRYTRETIYWLTYDTTSGLRGTLALAPGDPLRWDEDTLYNARYVGPTGDRWFGREVQTAQTVTATLTLPSAIPAGTPLQLGLVGMEHRAHTLAVAANGQALGSVVWSDAAVPLVGQPQAATLILTMPLALPAGLTRFDLTLISTGLPSERALKSRGTTPKPAVRSVLASLAPRQARFCAWTDAYHFCQSNVSVRTRLQHGAA